MKKRKVTQREQKKTNPSRLRQTKETTEKKTRLMRNRKINELIITITTQIFLFKFTLQQSSVSIQPLSQGPGPDHQNNPQTTTTPSVPSPFKFELTCPANSYKNWAEFRCTQCGTNQILSTTKIGCECDTTSTFLERDRPYFNCTKCPNNEVSFPNSTSCTPASSTSCPAGSHLNFFQSDGELVVPVNCQACDLNSKVEQVNSEHGSRCTPCGANKGRDAGQADCSCKGSLVSGGCLSASDFQNMEQKFPLFNSGSKDSVSFNSLVGTSVPSRTAVLQSSLFECHFQRVS